MSTCGVGVCALFCAHFFFSSFFHVWLCLLLCGVSVGVFPALKSIYVSLCLVSLYIPLYGLYVVGVPLFLSVYRSGVKCKVGVFAVGKFLYVCVCGLND
jgi:hypothetical protein